MTTAPFRPILLGLIILSCLAVVGTLNKKPYSLSLNSVSATLSDARLSFKGALTTGNTEGTSYAYINTTAEAYPSTSATQLVAGQTVKIGAAGTMGTYTIASTSAHNLLYLKSPSFSTLQTGNATSGNDVISSISSTLTVKLTTANALNNGRFRILVPAETSDTISTDGIPDVGKFDGGFNNASPNINATVTCPTDVGSTFDFVTGTATRSGIAIGTQEYHSFECAYSGTGGSGTAFNSIANDPFTISNLINPAPAAGHTIGLADTPRIVIQHLNNQFAVIDQTVVAVGLIEAVKVTASVAPQITFRIIGVNSGVSACGNNTTVTTTANIVPLADLLISQFTRAAQTLSVSTNAVNGYAVTVRESDQLSRNGSGCAVTDPGDTTPTDARTEDTSCIPDSTGNGDNMSNTAKARWDSTTYKGFGYSLHDNNSVGAIEAFSYDETSGNCAGGTECYKQFADAQAGETAESVMSNTIPVENDNLLVCYKAVIGSKQAAGDYENYLLYIATATF